ncbi:MAG: HU family DNA-binding protein [Prevotella sp.]|nr:HU family DNA-binding protein [Prevotella sp.]
MGKIYINDLISALMQKHGLTRHDAQQFINLLAEVIQQGVTNDRMVKIKGLGTFKIVDVDARESVNVNTGERVVIDSHSRLTFVPDATMKNLVNRPFSQFETVILNEGVTFDDEDFNDLLTASDIEDGTEETEQLEPVIEEQYEPTSGLEPEAETKTEPEPIAEPEPVIEFEPEHVVEQEPEPKSEPEPAVEEKQAIEHDYEVASSYEEGLTTEPDTEPIEEESPSISTPAGIASEVYSSLEEEPAIKKHPGEESEEEPTDEEPTDEEPTDKEPTDEEPTDEEPTDEEDEAETPASHKSRWWLWLLLVLLVSAICFGIGLFIGKQDTEPIAPQPAKTATKVGPTPIVTTKSTASQTEEDTTEQQVEETLEPVAEQAPEPAKSTQEEEWAKYEAMDVRVKTGAYNIVGLDRVVEVRRGENTRRIARRTMGEGMECYIEVYNGITASTPLQPGMEIKIPKVKMKASAIRRLRQSNNQ